MSTSESVLNRPNADGFDRQFDARTDAVTAARHALREWLAQSGCDEGPSTDGKTPDLLLVASELTANAVRANATWFRLRAWREDGGVAIEVADDGPGFDAPLPSLEELPPLEAENGRGLFLVRLLADRCTIFTGDTGTIVRCRVRI